MSQKLFANFLLVSMLFAFPLFAYAKKNISKRTNSASKNLFAASPRQNEMLVIGTLKQLYTAEATYFTTNSQTVGDRRFGSLFQLFLANLIDVNLASGEKYGYYFTVQSNNSLLDPTFTVYAVPKTYRKTGVRSFYFDASGKVRGGDKNGALAGVEDAVIDTCTATIAYDNEKQIIQAMRTLHSAQETYLATVGNGNYASIFLQLEIAGMINSWLGSGFYYNYDALMIVQARTEQTPPSYKIYMVPADTHSYGQMGFRSFFIDQTGVLRGADHQGGQPSENDPPIVENKEEK